MYGLIGRYMTSRRGWGYSDVPYIHPCVYVCMYVTTLQRCGGESMLCKHSY